MTEDLFAIDIDGPKHMGTLFDRNLTNDGNDQLIMVSPGLNLAPSGSLQLWQLLPPTSNSVTSPVPLMLPMMLSLLLGVLSSILMRLLIGLVPSLL